MTYNIHPIFVHFPIALLFIYSIIKILPFKKWLPKIAWDDICFVVLIVGVLGAFMALSTGDTAEHLSKANHHLINIHATFASISTWLYVALLLGEISHFFNQSKLAEKVSLLKFKKVTAFCEKLFYGKLFSKIVSLVALLFITLTGMLGGIIVYGVSADPFASTLLKILGISI